MKSHRNQNPASGAGMLQKQEARPRGPPWSPRTGGTSVCGSVMTGKERVSGGVVTPARALGAAGH